MTLTVQPSHVRITTTGDNSNNGSTTNSTTTPANDQAADEVPNAVKAAQTLNGGVGSGMEKNGKNSPQDSDKEFRLTVIPSESDNNSSKTTSPSLTRVSSLNRKTSNSSGNGKSQSAVGNNNNNSSMHSIPKSVSRDSMKVVNEKTTGDNGNATTTTTTTTEEDDSDDEKLSPLLNNSKSLQQLNESVALKMDGVDENIDDGSDGEGNNHNIHEVRR